MGGKDFLAKLTGPDVFLHSISGSVTDKDSKKDFEQSVVSAFVEDQKVMFNETLLGVSNLNSAPGKPCPNCAGQPSFPDPKSCAKYASAPGLSRNRSSRLRSILARG